MLYSVVFLGSFGIVKSVKRSDEISCNAADSVKSHSVGMLLSAAAWTSIAYDSGISAAWITINGMIDSSVAYAGFFHTADNLLKS